MNETAEAQSRIAQLAALRTTHRAFHWLHLHQPQLRAWQLEFLAIPAPTFQEQARAHWFLQRFTDLGLTNPHFDAAGNALAELAGIDPGNIILLSAHLDTVFPSTPITPLEDGPRILAPGACDNGAGLTALLALIAAIKFAEITPQATILFAANTGEEGEGDLHGMRHLFTASPYAPRIRAALALEGSGTAAAVTRALGSRRFRVTLTGPGGHSWTDAAAPNPITLIARALTQLAQHPALGAGNTTLTPTLIQGGTSINSIPPTATVSLDLRATDPTQLTRLTLDLHRTFEHIVAETNRTSPNATTLSIETIGDRPAATLPPGSPLLHTLRAVDRHLNLRTEFRLGSTDANIPLALNIPAAALAAGGTAHGIHTLAEWHDPTGRELALRRILLTLLDLTLLNLTQST